MHQWNSSQTSEKHLQMCTVSTVNLEKSDLNQFTFINTKGGIRRLLHPVPHDGSGTNTGRAHKLEIVNDLWAHAVSGLKEQRDLFWMLTQQETQSGNFDKIFSFVVVRSFTADIDLLQATGGLNRTPSHVTFSRTCVHSFQCRTWHWLKVSCAYHVMSSCVWLCVWSDTLRPCTLHSSPSLSSSFSFSCSSSSASMWVGSMRSPMRTSANEELGTLAESNLLTQPALLSPFRDPGGMRSRPLGNAEPQQQAARYLEYAWYIGKRFCRFTRRPLHHLIQEDSILGFQT